MLKKSVLLVFVLMVASEFVLGDKFSLTGKGNAVAVVKDQKLYLKVERGLPGDYSSAKKFELSIGECKIDISAGLTSAGKMIVFSFELSGISTAVNNPNTFTIENGNFKTVSSESKSESLPISCNFKFEQASKGYKIKVRLAGNVPSSFRISSDTADLYIDPKSNKDGKGKVIGALIGGIIITLIAIIASSVVIGFLIHRRHRKQKEKERMKTAISSEGKAEGKSEAPKKVDKKAKSVEHVKTAESVDLGTEEAHETFMKSQPDQFVPSEEMLVMRDGFKVYKQLMTEREMEKMRGMRAKPQASVITQDTQGEA